MLRTILLCVCVAVVVRCDCATLKCSVSPPMETASTTLRLTAQRNDTGSWTTRFGDYQMTIEHRHFKTTKDNYDKEGTWTIKVKHTSTAYQDATNNIIEPDIEASDQLETAISNPVDNSSMLPDYAAVSEPIRDATTTKEDPSIEVGAELPLPSNDISEETESSEDGSPYEHTDERRIETPDDNNNNNTRVEQEQLMAAEEKTIMERYPRSGSLAHYITERRNYSKGYQFYAGTGWLKLNTSDWQWPEARAACEEDGGHLSVPATTQDLGVFKEILKENADVLKRTVLKNQVFIGVFYPEGSRKLTTVLGKLFQTGSNSVWFPDEPNNVPPGEDCITLHLEGKMRDVPCFYTLPFLCQID